MGVSRLRPFARRRFKTNCPALLPILARKPWVFALRRLFGWNVRLDMKFSLNENRKTNRRAEPMSRKRPCLSTVVVRHSPTTEVADPVLGRQFSYFFNCLRLRFMQFCWLNTGHMQPWLSVKSASSEVSQIAPVLWSTSAWYPAFSYASLPVASVTMSVTYWNT